MFKKKILASLLLVTMVFAMGVQASAVEKERKRIFKTEDCRKICKLMKAEEKNSIKEIAKMKNKQTEISEHFGYVIRNFIYKFGPSFENPNYDEKREYIENLYDFYLGIDLKKDKKLKEDIAKQKNFTQALWKEYQEVCPQVDCHGVYGGVNNNIDSTDIFSL